MTGKTIQKAIELENGYQILVFDDGTTAFVKVVTEVETSDLLEALQEEEKPAGKGKGKKEEKAPEKPAGKGGKKQPEPEPEETEVTAEDLMEMDEEELTDFIEEQELETDPDDFETLEDLRAAVAEELDIELPKKSKGKKK